MLLIDVIELDEDVEDALEGEFAVDDIDVDDAPVGWGCARGGNIGAAGRRGRARCGC